MSKEDDKADKSAVTQGSGDRPSIEHKASSVKGVETKVVTPPGYVVKDGHVVKKE